ncbi:MAG TPA: stage III sporulation protein AD [Peptococcaceae bacterium]|jgi:stage III sporulation protein AD|nr:stage III sporulation protein AD [Clostridia bacterium]HOB81521.1 stage III sporulation protein AD [Peptococcaceae bacterium]HPZ71755.1 stage III sporulation protein AD [Peptococcaceae bacterium]HQD53609.1 stage III sporulation protein AD [Peptococcaceae bacterium]
MEVFQVVGIGLTGTILAVYVKESNKEMAVFISLATGLILFIFALSKMGTVLEVMNELAARAQINMFYLTTVLKIMGIAYIAEFGAQVCKDAGEGSIATKIELAAKILVLALALPIITAILESILRLIPS